VTFQLSGADYAEVELRVASALAAFDAVRVPRDTSADFDPLTPAEEGAALVFNSPEDVAAEPYRSLRRSWKALYFVAHYGGYPAPTFEEWRAALNA
jgi:hypothetical protein